MLNLQGKRVWVTGHMGLVGKAMVQRLTEIPGCEVIFVDRGDLDLRYPVSVEAWVKGAKPDIVIHTAAMVNGISDNLRRPADFITNNLRIDTAVISACKEVELFVYLGSACAYPRNADRPFREEAFMTGPPEPTNEAYAVSKLAGMELLEAHKKQYGLKGFTVAPCNVYGPGDRSSHVIPSLFKKLMAAAKEGAPEIEIWGTGKPLREFIYSHDAADAILHLIESDHGYPVVNIGSGDHINIQKLAHEIGRIVGYEGVIVMDCSKPDGIPHKTLNLNRISSLGWERAVPLLDGLVLYHASLSL